MSYDADLNQALDAVNKTFISLSADIYSQDLPGCWREFCMDIPAGGGDTVENDFLGFTDTMREWLGSKQIKQWRAYKQTITTKPYERTYAVDRQTMKYRNKSGAISKQIANFLSMNAQTYDEQWFNKLVANPTGYDGVSVYNASHPHGNSTNSNTGTTALSRAGYEATKKAMMSWQNEFGQPIPSIPDTIMVGPAREKLAKEIFGAETRSVAVDHTGAEVTANAHTATSIQNIYYGELKVVVNPRLADGTRDNYWYLFNTKTPFAPITRVVSDEIHGVTKDQPTDDNVFFDRQFLYSLEGDFVFDAGLWWTSYLQAETA